MASKIEKVREEYAKEKETMKEVQAEYQVAFNENRQANLKVEEMESRVR